MRARRQDRQPDDVLGPRALAAMADAARRSREANDEPETATPRRRQRPRRPPARTGINASATGSVPPVTEPTSGSVLPSTSAPSPGPSPSSLTAPDPVSESASRTASSRSASAAADRDRSDARRDERSRSSVLIVSLALVAVVAALIGTWAIKGSGGTAPTSSAHQGGPAAPPSSAPPTAQAGSSSGGTTPTRGATLPAPTTPVGSTPTTAPPAPSSGTGPQLTTLTPASGIAGQVLVIEGSNLVSPSGQITAHFGTETATVACPAQTSCIVQVPQNTASTASVPFTVTTDTGTSNPLTFSYS